MHLRAVWSAMVGFRGVLFAYLGSGWRYTLHAHGVSELAYNQISFFLFAKGAHSMCWLLWQELDLDGKAGKK
jgi:hypothetical protein